MPSPATPAGTRTTPRTLAILGCPNSGKSTLFNRLTGLRQKVANYPGVTVERHSGRSEICGPPCAVLDLPGTYSLSAQSPDERVVIDALEGRFQDDRPDLLLCVVDPLQLRRHLFLVLQAAELGLPALVVVNFWDRVQARRIPLDLAALEEFLGVPCIPISAATGQGLDALTAAVARALQEPVRLRPITWSAPIESALAILAAAARAQSIPASRADLMRILFDAHPAVPQRLGWADSGWQPALREARDFLQQRAIHPLAAEPVILNRQIDTLLPRLLPDESLLRDPVTRRIDHLLTHPVAGLLLFVFLIFIVFQSVYSWAGPLMDAIEAAKFWLQGAVEPLFAATPILQSLVVNGLLEGVGSVLVFLPQILILFFFVALLEDSGYMARAAFLMDKMFSWCGLSGKSFVPLISSYACAIPGILAARTIDDPKTRLTTIFIAPFMSCSARLPVYLLLIGAFVEPRFGAFWAGVVLFAMHLVGLLVAIPVAWVLNHVILKTRAQPFVLELPSYRWPRLSDVGLRLANQAKRFLGEAGSIIFAITILIWALSYFPRPDPAGQTARAQAFFAQQAAAGELPPDLAATLPSALLADPASYPDWAARLERAEAAAAIENSFLGRAGKAIQPLFATAGFDWKITVGVLSSFPAREVIISTLGVIYSLGGDVDAESGDLRAALARQTWPPGSPSAGRPVFSLPVVFAIMVFFALCQQCGATVAIIARELSWAWALASFSFMTLLAWLAAAATFHLGSFLAP